MCIRDSYYAIVNYPGDGETKFRPDRTIVFQMEPRSTTEQWGPWSSPDPRQFLQVRTHDRYRNNLEWHLDLTYDELTTQPIPKTAQLLSLIHISTRRRRPRLREPRPTSAVLLRPRSHRGLSLIHI